MKFRRRLQLKQGIDLTPMIDVVFNLLIFFMIGSTLIDTPQLKITLPESNASEGGDDSKIIIITISENDNLYIGSEEVSFDNLGAKLSNMSKEDNALEKTVQVRADENVITKNLIFVIDSVKESGFTKLSIATDSKP